MDENEIVEGKPGLLDEWASRLQSRFRVLGILLIVGFCVPWAMGERQNLLKVGHTWDEVDFGLDEDDRGTEWVTVMSWDMGPMLDEGKSTASDARDALDRRSDRYRKKKKRVREHFDDREKNLRGFEISGAIRPTVLLLFGILMCVIGFMTTGPVRLVGAATGLMIVGFALGGSGPTPGDLYLGFMTTHGPGRMDQLIWACWMAMLGAACYRTPGSTGLVGRALMGGAAVWIGLALVLPMEELVDDGTSSKPLIVWIGKMMFDDDLEKLQWIAGATGLVLGLTGIVALASGIRALRPRPDLDDVMAVTGMGPASGVAAAGLITLVLLLLLPWLLLSGLSESIFLGGIFTSLFGAALLEWLARAVALPLSMAESRLLPLIIPLLRKQSGTEA